MYSSIPYSIEKPIDILEHSELGELMIQEDYKGFYFTFEFFEYKLN